MRKSIFISAVAILFICIESHAQSMTYNHDASKQGQIQVMELGAGNLTPELYYTVTHRRYKNGAKAATSVKNTLRIAANTASIPQVEYADSIQADLEGRAKIEAANIADRQVDLAWVTEGNKIESKLLAFKNNINALNGKAQTEEITNWTELGQMYDFAIKATRQAYMPNSERQKQYLAIYKDILLKNTEVCELILALRHMKSAKEAMATARAPHRANIVTIARSAHGRWKVAMAAGGGIGE